jgi:hypothetical protein
LKEILAPHILLQILFKEKVMRSPDILKLIRLKVVAVRGYNFLNDKLPPYIPPVFILFSDKKLSLN